MHGLIIDIEVPYFACFRKPTATSVVMTYPVPPFTTIIGLVANALGIPRQRYFEGISWLQERLKLNVRSLKPLERPTRELAKILKLVGEAREELRPVSFPSSPMYKYMLIRPSFRIYLAGEEKGFLEEIAAALGNPQRPLYLGQSDDMADVSIAWEGEVKVTEGREAWGLVPMPEVEGQRLELLRLPLIFESERVLRYSPILGLPERFPLRLPRAVKLFLFDDEGVFLYGAEDAVREAGE